MTKVSPRRNKHRGAQDERDVARILQLKRYPADTGGPVDLAADPETPGPNDYLVVQVKGGLAVVNDTLRQAMASAKVGALGGQNLPAVALVDRKGGRVKRYLVFELETWADWHSGGGPEPGWANEALQGLVRHASAELLEDWRAGGDMLADWVAQTMAEKLAAPISSRAAGGRPKS